MPSPVAPSQFSNVVPSASASLCDKIKATLLELPALLRDFFAWALAADGSISDAFANEVNSKLFQPGDCKWSFASTVTAGWLRAEGQAVLRTTYAALFASLGTRFGAGDGSTTFNLPDGKKRYLRCVGSGLGLGDVGGAEMHTQTVAEMPAHQHNFVLLDDTAGPDTQQSLTYQSNGSSSTTRQTAFDGGGQPFSVLDPHIGAYLLIKT